MHFIARCLNYPELKFNVSALKPFYAKQGREKTATWVKFVGGVFDSKADGFTIEEAIVIRKALEQCAKHGSQITFTEVTPFTKKGSDLQINA